MKRSLLLAKILISCQILLMGVRCAFSQDYIKIQVIDSSEGLIGQRLVYYVKEEIRKSSTFDLVDPAGSRWQMIVNAMPKDQDYPNNAAIYSIVWNLVMPNADGTDGPSMFFDSTLGYCGANVVEQSASDIIARTDKIISEFRSALLKSATKN